MTILCPLFPELRYSEQADRLLVGLGNRGNRVMRRRVAQYCWKNFSRLQRIVSDTSEFVVAKLKKLAVLIKVSKIYIGIIGVIRWDEKATLYGGMADLLELANRQRVNFAHYITVLMDDRQDPKVVAVFYRAFHGRQVREWLVYPTLSRPVRV